MSVAGRERYQVVYGARLRVKEGSAVKLGEVLAEWDPYTYAIPCSRSAARCSSRICRKASRSTKKSTKSPAFRAGWLPIRPDEGLQPAIAMKGAKSSKRYLLRFAART